MGVLFSVLRDLVIGKRAKILILGLPGSGKTTILNILSNNLDKLGKVVPTTDLNYETIQKGNLMISVIDLAGDEEKRNQWNIYYDDDVDAIIYVVDSSANDMKLKESVKVFWDIINERKLSKNCCFVIFANKQDTINAKSKLEIGELIGITKLEKTERRPWRIFGSCAFPVDKIVGIKEGIEWMCVYISRK